MATASYFAASAAAQDGATVRVLALDCALDVPAASQIHIDLNSRVRIKSRDPYDTASIEIAALDQSIPSREHNTLQSTTTNGPLTIQRYEFTPGGIHNSKPLFITLVRGQSQQIQFVGVPETDIDRYVKKCVSSMDPAILAASARQSRGCKSTITFKQTLAAIGKDVRTQLVFSDGRVLGYHLFGPDPLHHSSNHGIRDGGVLTRVCGVPAAEVLAAPNSICCETDVSKSIEITFRDLGKPEQKVLIDRDP